VAEQPRRRYHPPVVADEHTTAVVERYLGQLAGASGDDSAERIIRELLSTSVRRLHLLCATLLRRNYPRLAQPPMNLEAEEMLSGVVERMMKALRKVRPKTVREFFALANQHMRWELNDLARRLDHQARAEELHASAVESPTAAGQETSQLTHDAARMMQAIEDLPEDERETFCLVRVQGMTQADAADVLGVSVKTIQRRLARTVPLLAMQLRDLQPPPPPPHPPGADAFPSQP
jgi:RNA polymerase sigma factor (sigma-70 family)